MSPVGGHTENVLLIVLVQLIVIVGSARVFGALFQRVGQPLVCGEIAAGLILGPTVFGGMFPELFQKVFDPSVSPVFSILSQLGLIFLLFLIGLEFDFGHLANHRGTALAVSVTGVVLPFTLGFLLARWMAPQLGITHVLDFALFMGAAMSITAIPILGRIMLELNINRTRIGALTISAAAVDDATGWIILALVTAIVRSTLDPLRFSLMVVAIVAFAVAMIRVVRPLLKKWTAAVMERNGGTLSLDALAILLLLLLLAAITTNLIGIFSIFGAFFLGALLYDAHAFRAAVQERLRDFVTVFFLPIFFTYTGLRTDIGSMSGAGSWAMCGLVLLTATVGKFGGCWLAARATGLGPKEASMVGVMMNTRALMELIVINIGYDLGVIPKDVFFMLVFMAVVTTYVTAPLLRRLLMASDLAPVYLQSAFARRVEAR